MSESLAIHTLDAGALVTLYGTLRLSPKQALSALLDRIERHDRELGCFLRLDREGALAEAERSEARYAAGRALGPLDGVPVALKDNLCQRGRVTTAGSRMLESHVASYDATVVERLKAAGALLVGQTNLDEFGMGSSTEHSAFRKTHNPWDPSRVPGGSSGGSAAAVAAGFVPLALGSDTGGSVRQPAALVGVLGLRPGYGSVSRHGLIAFASSLDQVGPLARSAEDLASLLQVIAGPDPRDATCLPGPRPVYRAQFDPGLGGLKVGVPKEYFVAGLDAEVERPVAAALERLAGLGARLVEISLPHTSYGIPCYYVIANAEASSNLARFDGVRYGLRARAGELYEMYARSRGRGFGPEVKRRIMLGTYTLAKGYYDAYYLQALRVRERIRAELAQALEGVDCIAAPVTPSPAFRLGEKLDDPLHMYLADVFTVPAALAGIPALALPCGRSRDGLPVGLQLLGPQGAEPRLLGVARALAALPEFQARVAPLTDAERQVGP